jgi:hypothetical protein
MRRKMGYLSDITAGGGFQDEHADAVRKNALKKPLAAALDIVHTIKHCYPKVYERLTTCKLDGMQVKNIPLLKKETIQWIQQDLMRYKLSLESAAEKKARLKKKVLKKLTREERKALGV